MARSDHQTSLELAELLGKIRQCRECAAVLPSQPRPVLAAGTSAKVMIIGQAPGRRVHDSGIPWDDPSGNRLRKWLGVDSRTFYDES
ncbi:MAG TPA: uracil-DNA glycosylase, partial [Planctomycetaceae bacterium]|nr:uracil-DNA glycosylase [Planctomycetaceae bacterium]